MHLEAIQKSPHKLWIIDNTAMGAVSALRIRGPRETA